MSGSTYWPASFVVIACTRPVSVLVAVTLAFAITAPEGSITVPSNVACWATAGMQAKANRAEISISPRLRLLEERTKRESMDGVIATSRIEVKLAHNGHRHEP